MSTLCFYRYETFISSIFIPVNIWTLVCLFVDLAVGQIEFEITFPDEEAETYEIIIIKI